MEYSFEWEWTNQEPGAGSLLYLWHLHFKGYAFNFYQRLFFFGYSYNYKAELGHLSWAGTPELSWDTWVVLHHLSSAVNTSAVIPRAASPVLIPWSCCSTARLYLTAMLFHSEPVSQLSYFFVWIESFPFTTPNWQWWL